MGNYVNNAVAIQRVGHPLVGPVHTFSSKFILAPKNMPCALPEKSFAGAV